MATRRKAGAPRGTFIEAQLVELRLRSEHAQVFQSQKVGQLTLKSNVKSDVGIGIAEEDANRQTLGILFSITMQVVHHPSDEKFFEYRSEYAGRFDILNMHGLDRDQVPAEVVQTYISQIEWISRRRLAETLAEAGLSDITLPAPVKFKTPERHSVG